MTVQERRLADEAARITALTALDRSLMVEAGAGAGKTALMAGRVAMLLAAGMPPKEIVAVTFTELAASDLLLRIRGFVEELLAGRVPIEMRAAVGEGLTEAQIDNLEAASAEIDQITCSTIHGFCQNLIKPYPAEAEIDPGATILDPGGGDLLFEELTDEWLRDRLSGNEDGLLAELVLVDPDKAVALIRSVAQCLRRHRQLDGPEPMPLNEAAQDFQRCVEGFRSFMAACPVHEPETAGILSGFERMAAATQFAEADDSPAAAVRLLACDPEPDLCKSDGDFLAFRKKGKWQTAARAVRSSADAVRLFEEAREHYDACCTAWRDMLACAAGRVLSALVDEVRPLIARFQDRKRATAVLDFDDLLHSARDLLRDNDEVRQALGRRYTHVLVDEFQDTDPLQAEIFWRLCGDPPADRPEAGWIEWTIRPGSLFLVGDPKQAIYRFRGADVAAYLAAREAIRASRPADLLHVSTNFRSCRSILSFVNERFHAPLTADGQPGFTALSEFRDDHGDRPAVVALDVQVPPDENGKFSAEARRDCEAEAVADLCNRLIGALPVFDQQARESRPCRAGDIALLAPTGTDLWRYEQALEARGIPVASQAGKGFFRRQEVQDLVALTRTLADHRDTLALFSLLRGPLVGLTEEELLDIIEALPPRDEHVPARLSLLTDPAAIPHKLARGVLTALRSLWRRRNQTTPYDLLSQAVAELRIRPILAQRHEGSPERALANVDLFLAMARPYAVRGLRSFAEAMSTAWEDGSRTVEGHPDSAEEAVSLITMHSAKGLEWPIVIPINTATAEKASDSLVIDRAAGRLYAPILGKRPRGYDQVRSREDTELALERVRLWYVATTRAKDLLVFPRLAPEPPASAWIHMVQFGLAELVDLQPAALVFARPERAAEAVNHQSAELFADEAERLRVAERHLVWVAPSRAEGVGAADEAEEEEIIVPGEENGEPTSAPPTILGSRDRGSVLHKLMEEVLTGEIAEEEVSLRARAENLVRMLGQEPASDPAAGLSPAELARTVIRALAVPEVAAVRHSLLPEFPVYGTAVKETGEEVTSGVVDAIFLGNDGEPALVIDWKSDIAPNPQEQEVYRWQVSQYLSKSGAPRGIIVFMARGSVVQVRSA